MEVGEGQVRQRRQEGAAILTVTERGFGKRTPLDEYRLQGRAGKGIIDLDADDRVGSVARVDSESTAPVEAQ